eukprot:augustus_masked-scaffold_22-processed-gene-3.46-mRNA-1 protein AED:0.50 eAED:0.51 QI:0/-1/0/1/-1/1/1/0/1020
MQKIFNQNILENDSEYKLSVEEFEREKERRKSEKENDLIFLYCIVFPVKAEVKSFFSSLFETGKDLNKEDAESWLESERVKVLRAVRSAGFQTQLIYTANKEHVLCKIGCNDLRLLKQADFLEYKLEVDPGALKHVLELKALEERTGAVYPENPVEKINLDFQNYTEEDYYKIQYPHGNQFPPLFIMNSFNYNDGENHEQHGIGLEQVKKSFLLQSLINPFSHIHFKFDFDWEIKICQQHGVQLYKKYNDGTILRTADRIYLLQVALEQSARKVKGIKGAGLDLMKLQFEGIISAHYPIQFSRQASKAKDLTANELYGKFFKKIPFTSLGIPSPFKQPIQDVRNFTGEKIGFYFSFLESYSWWLIPVAVLAILVSVLQLMALQVESGSLNFVTKAVPVFSLSLENVTYLEREEIQELILKEEHTTIRTPFALDTENTTVLFTLVPIELPYIIPVYSVLVSFWAALFLEFWKQKEQVLAFYWGTSEYVREAVTRPEFKSKYTVPDAVTGLPVPFTSANTFKLRIAASGSLIFTAGTVTLAAFAATYIFEIFISASSNLHPNLAEGIAYFVNAVAIYFLQYLFKFLARILTEWENHRTDLEHENYLIGKTFVFSFFNSYTTLAYFAFFRNGSRLLDGEEFCVSQLDDLIDSTDADEPIFELDELSKIDTCYGTVGYLLVIIFVTQIILDNALEIIKPFISNKLAKRDASNDITNNGISTLVSPAEVQFLLSPYMTPFDDYLELAIQFGYVVLFVSAFPLAPVLAFINTFIEVWVDAKKICTLSRRPLVERAHDIGSWLDVFVVLSYVAVLVNSGILVFSSNELLPINTYEGRIWAFLLLIIGTYALKWMTDFSISTIPSWIAIQKRRQNYYLHQVFYDDEDREDAYQEFQRNHRSTKQEEETFVKDEFKPFDQDPYLESLVVELKYKVRQAGSTAEEIFAEMDLNEDDTVSNKEMRKILERYLGGEMSATEVAFVVQSLDFDRDGKVERQEVLDFFHRLEEDPRDLTNQTQCSVVSEVEISV